MKKTLITILALAGVAMAESLTLYTGIKYDGELHNGYTKPTEPEGLNYVYGNWPGSVNNSLAFSIDIDQLFNADQIGTTDIITLNSLTVKIPNNGWAFGGNRVVTLTVQGQEDTYTYTNTMTSIGRNGGDLTLSGINWEGLTKDTMLTFAISSNNEDCTVALAGSQNGVWSGVTTFDTTGAEWINKNDGYTDVETNAAPLVSLGITTAPIPEPTTATLSLLALAGLAARRRRK